MKYIVSDEFGGGVGWTPDKLAAALKAPMAAIGVTVERVPGYVGEDKAGFQALGLPPDMYKRKFDEVGRVLKRVLRWYKLRRLRAL